ncbi:MAG: YebC/PmpR family DNA-binding transcriptional regulator [Clostridia bacterium]|nr:YebC/PmpR family DNA-binding transcriptional regulator [Clostridia bacterium]MBR0026586.1 YebC/PmpR family DNA-binding transcriptional regulator [Clostridia bacterium]
MSGHSKWANIKNKKEKTDAQRGKIFTKIGREIAIAVKEGGSDPANNSKLRDVIAKAKANNMPNDNITRSIKKAAGELGSVNYEEVTYEGYGPGGVAVIVEVVTDNRNRTAAEMRHIFDKSGGSMGASGCVAWMFNRKGVMVVERSAKIDEDEFMMAALDAGAEDFVPQDDVYEIYTDPNDFSAVREALETAGYEFLSAEIQMIPQNTTDLTNDPETVEKFMRLLDRFDDNDDVGEVFHNAILPEEEEED